ncbi:hypothetical protein D9M71_403520 [compost metagenome]
MGSCPSPTWSVSDEHGPRHEPGPAGAGQPGAEPGHAAAHPGRQQQSHARQPGGRRSARHSQPPRDCQLRPDRTGAHRPRRHAAARDRSGTVRGWPDAALRTATSGSRSHPGWHGRGRAVGATAAVGRVGARLCTGYTGNHRPRQAAALWWRSDEERGRLRRLAADGGQLRLPRAAYRGIAESAAAPAPMPELAPADGPPRGAGGTDRMGPAATADQRRLP